MVVTVDDLLDRLYPYHIPIYLFAFIRGMPFASSMMMIAFTAPKIRYWCMDDDMRWLNQTDQCEISKNVETINGSSIYCQSWSYDRSEYGITLIEQFDLVCDRHWLISLSQSLYLGGITGGILIFAHISDWWGRKTVTIISLVLSLAASLGTAISPNFTVYCIMRFLSGMSFCGFGEVAFTLVVETIGPNFRYMPTITVGLGLSSGMVILPVVAYFVQDWFKLQLAICVPLVALIMLWMYVTLCSFINGVKHCLMFRVLPESPRWQLSVGHYEAARENLKSILKYNKRYSAMDVDTLIEDTKLKNKIGKQTTKATVRDLFRKQYILPTVIFSFIMAASSMVWYHLTLSTARIPGSDPYWSYATAACFEFPIKFVNLVLIKWAPRRLSLLCSFTMAGFMLLLTFLVPKSIVWLSLMLLIFGKLCTSANGSVMRVSISETFPTVARAVAMGFIMTFGRIGMAIAPFFDEVGALTYDWVPFAFVCVLTWISAGMTQLLKETFKQTLPDLLEKRSSKKVKTISENVA